MRKHGECRESFAIEIISDMKKQLTRCRLALIILLVETIILAAIDFQAK